MATGTVAAVAATTATAASSRCAGGHEPVAVRVPDAAAHLAGDLALRDGTTVHVRPIRPDDAPALRAFHARLSPDTIELRYFGLVPVLSDQQIHHLTCLDYENRMALIATIGAAASEQLVAVVRYERIGREAAEVAFVVEDRWQRHGIASALFQRLVGYARDRGFRTMVAEVMADNTPMRALLRHAGYPCTMTYADGAVEFRLDIAPLAHSAG